MAMALSCVAHPRTPHGPGSGWGDMEVLGVGVGWGSTGGAGVGVGREQTRKG